MSQLLIGFSIGLAAGVVLSRYALSEAAIIKQHVTEEVTKLRGELADFLRR